MLAVSTTIQVNTNTNTINNTVTVAAAPAVIQTVAAPQVLGVKELPKTGLPALAWSALAFIPAGFRMRGFRKIKKDIENDPHFIWDERQYKAGA